MRISDWSSDVCSSDLRSPKGGHAQPPHGAQLRGLVLGRIRAAGGGSFFVPCALSLRPVYPRPLRQHQARRRDRPHRRGAWQTTATARPRDRRAAHYGVVLDTFGSPPADRVRSPRRVRPLGPAAAALRGLSISLEAAAGPARPGPPAPVLTPVWPHGNQRLHILRGG